MRNINWIGIIDEKEIEKYQKGNLDSNAVKMKMPKNMNQMMIKSMPFTILAFAIMMLTGHLKEHIYNKPIIYREYVFIGLLIGIALLLVHELLHAIVYPKGVATYIGIIKPFTFCSLASYPLSKSRFIVMCLLPYILGIIPFIIFWILPANYSEINSIFWAIALMGIASPSPDAYNVYQVIKQVPKGKKVQFYVDDTYYI